MRLSEEWRRRGLIHQVTDEAVLDGLDAGTVTAYIGFDPTADSLHLGSLMQICLLRRLQMAGNAPIALAGGGTGLIGDPTDRDSERPLLDVATIDANVEAIGAQLERFLDFSADAGSARARLLNNAQWLTTVSLTEFLRDVGKHVTVNQMVAKESVRSRLDREDVGLSFTEFSYMLLQGYDFVRLNRDFGCTLQMGGSDQWGNITVGAELVRKMNHTAAFGLTSPLITRGDGSKFGKTATGENVWLDASRTSPFAMHQFFLNCDDVVTQTLLRYVTFVDLETLDGLAAAAQARPAEREAQRRLADEVVALVHGPEAARAARLAGEALFDASIADFDEATLLQVMSEVPTSTWSRAELSAGVDPAELLVRVELARSKAEARRFLDQGGVYVNNVRLEPGELVGPERVLHGRYLVLRRGRRLQHLVVVG